MVSSILPKTEHWHYFQYIELCIAFGFFGELRIPNFAFEIVWALPWDQKLPKCKGTKFKKNDLNINWLFYYNFLCHKQKIRHVWFPSSLANCCYFWLYFGHFWPFLAIFGQLGPFGAALGSNGRLFSSHWLFCNKAVYQQNIPFWEKWGENLH